VKNIFKIILLGLTILLTNPQLHASHLVGAEITWDCLGNGDYVFELTIYRDCNGFDVSTNTQTIEVWGHPTVSDIPVDFIERTDLSPLCTPAGGANMLDCGTGTGSGTGPGAIEKVIYRSNPVTLSGIPPQNGWTFTFKDFSRNGDLTNIQDPLTYGLSVAAKMFPTQNAVSGECNDRSPVFLQNPYFISCAGQEYQYNPHAVDQDLDSLVFSWGEPMNDFTGVYDPPNNPAPVPFEPGFSFTNPTPDNTFNAANQNAAVDSENGEITFLSNTQGNFAIKVLVESYRNGELIATVERETQLIVTSCAGNNSAPIVTAPFPGSSFETTVTAGDLVNFTLFTSDPENLQDGTAQSNIIEASGFMFGDNYTNAAAGCEVTPCATLGNTPPTIGVQGTSLNFQWLTSCDHLMDRDGNMLSEVPYTFVFKVQDDYCPVPRVRYETVTIYVQNVDVIPPTTIQCIQTDDNNDVTIYWEDVADPDNVFAGYEIHRVGDGIVGTSNDVNISSFTIPGDGAQENDYFVNILSGCNGGTSSSSDTTKNIYLNVNNPNNGVALLEWNHPRANPLPHYGDYYHIYRELPNDTWQLIDSVPSNLRFYNDTITICQGFINYRIELPTNTCTFISNVDGDDFEDMITPDIPSIYSASVDSTSGDVIITWNENNQEDTYGYVIYTYDQNGFLIELDTIWGKQNTSYIHDVDVDSPQTYSVAAFDSCFTNTNPPTYQTSAKAEVHTTIFLTSSLNVCNRNMLLDWTSYVGFEDLSTYEVWAMKNNETWELLGSTEQNSFVHPIAFGDEYEVLIKAIDDGKDTSALSNIINVSFDQGSGPSYSYLAYASVVGGDVEILHRLSLDGGVQWIKLERLNELSGQFEEIDEKLVTTNNEVFFLDEEAEPNRRSYTYRTVLIDTCDQNIGISNIGKTIYAESITEEDAMVHTIQWTPYEEFTGNTISYRVYRGLDGNFDTTPFATTNPNVTTVTDSVISFIDNHQGKICYYVEAVEGQNQLALSETSKSNVICPVLEPLVYIPNAFSVGGLNPVFKPETRMHRIDQYQFEIYDRYGRVIFETADPNQGWDGSIHNGNRVAREGVYVYRLSIRDGNGIEVLKHGHVTLLDYR
jgi:gliding motility-associated-like protein